MPSTQRGNDLLTQVLDQYERIQTHLAELRALVENRVTAVESSERTREAESKRWWEHTWPKHLESQTVLEKRVAELETDKATAKGAAMALKVLWIGIPAAISAIGVAVNYLLTHGKLP